MKGISVILNLYIKTINNERVGPMRILLAIDIQRQFDDKSEEFQKIVNFCNNHREEYDAIVPTLFVNENRLFEDKLHWNGCKMIKREDCLVKPKNSKIIFKSGYALSNLKFLQRDDHVDVIGCDSDACVLAICFQLWDAGMDFSVLSNFIYTTLKKYGNETSLSIMKRNFGSCVI